ncbi:S-layer homology domain-containing protein [uncultured Oscillibacter sp.]|uniref:S-layer homology domain-containing protein n=1 Tax=uncultured Oscillibacter sp. TaxID=876091 RepID=UPI002617AA02|nr:S-layer homology domain-containing protein [uncultured Oscillibacter sp.]
MKTGKKLLALLLAVVMTMSLLTVGAFAEETPSSETPLEQQDSGSGNIPDDPAEGPADDLTGNSEDGAAGESDAALTAADTSYVAEVDGQQCETLQAAVDAVTGEASIKLIDSIVAKKGEIVTIPAGKTVTLDMAGNSITVESDFEGRPIVNEGTLTVTGNGIIDSSASENGLGAINNKGTLTIENGTYRGAVYGSGSGIRNTGKDAVLTIENGTFEKATCAVYNEGTAIIKGGTFSNHSCSACAKEDGHEGMWSYVIRNATIDSKMTIDGGVFTGTQGAVSAAIGSLTVNDGYFKTADCNRNHGAIFYALYAAGEVGEVETVINGGTFETDGKVTAVSIGNDNENGDGGINAQSAAEIRGGTFKAPEGVPAVKKATKTGNLAITGGTFSSDVSEYLAEGYVQNANGEVGSREEMMVAEVTTAEGVQQYTSLAEAVEAAANNSVIKLLKDTEGDGIVIDTSKKNLTIDFNTHSYTVSGSTVGSSGTETNAFQFLTGGSLTLKNGSIIFANQKTLLIGLQNYCNLTLENMVIDASQASAPCQYAISNNCGTVQFIGNTSIKAYKNQTAFDSCKFGSYEIPTVKIYTTGTITGDIELSGGKLEISAGTFEGNIRTVSGYAKGDAIITGGYFTSDPSDYVPENAEPKLFVVASDKTGYAYMVTTTKPTEVNPIVTEKTETEVSGSIKTEDKEKIEAVINNAQVSGVSDAVTESAQNAIINQVEGELKPEDKVVVEITVSLTADKADLTTEDKKYVSYKAEPVAKVIVNGKNKAENIAVPNDYLDGQTLIEVRLPIPAGLEPQEIMHIADDGTRERYLNGSGFTVEGGCAVLHVKHFSTFVLNGQLTVAAKIGESEYGTLQEAVNAAKSGDTIVLTQDCDEKISVSGKSVTIDLDGHTYDKDKITLGSRCSMSVSDDKITITYSAPSGGGSSSSSSGDYTVSVENSKHGTVTVSPKRADKGDTVTITVKPDNGYELDELTVTDKDGDTVKLQSKGGNKYTFTMPGSKVTVEATFTLEKEENLPFADVAEDYWAVEEITWAYENGYMNGVSAERFAPGNTVTRQQLWMVLARLTEFNPSNMTEAQHWAVESKISDGSNPGGALTRQQMVTILYRWAQQMGYDVSGRADLSAFPDNASVAAYATEPMTWAIADGIISGTTEGLLDPAGTATRAQFAVILYRFFETVM